MKILLGTHSTNSEFNGDCDYAVVDLTPTLVQQIRERVKLARQAGQRDNDLYELYFWGGTAECYSSALLDACEEVLAAAAEGANADQAAQDWTNSLEHNGHAILPAGVDLAAHTPERTECDQVIFRCSPSGHNPEIEVAWTASPKHSDVYVITADLRLTDLEGYLRQAQTTPA